MPESLPAKKPMRWLWIAIVVFVVAGAALYWRSSENKPVAVVIEVATVAPVSRVLAVNGQIAARRSVAIRSAVSATVVSVAVDEGDAVTAGDALATLDASQAKAAERQAHSALEQGLVRQAQAATDFGRMRDLGKNVARSMVEDADLALQGAAQDVARLQALLDQARIALDHYTLRAPITGTVMQRGIDPGQLLDPAISAFTVADLTNLVVQTDVDEAYATQIAINQKATLQLVGTTDLLPGSVQFVSTSVDATTGGLSVKIGFDAPVKAPVGLTVTVNIVVDQRQAISVPRTALMDGAVFLWVDGVARLVPVQVIDWPATRLIVTKGLAAGDVVIVDATAITEGQAVAQAVP